MWPALEKCKIFWILLYFSLWNDLILYWDLLLTHEYLYCTLSSQHIWKTDNVIWVTILNPFFFREGIQQQRIIIQNKYGEKLVGVLHETGSIELVILCHGFRSSKVGNCDFEVLLFMFSFDHTPTPVVIVIFFLSQLLCFINFLFKQQRINSICIPKLVMAKTPWAL